MRDELSNREVFVNLVEVQVLTKVLPRASLGLMSGIDNGGNVDKIQVFSAELIYISCWEVRHLGCGLRGQ